jgi:RimJ/RimL family protein N-acetyltransferase
MINLNTFILEEYKSFNKEHSALVKLMEEDARVRRYIYKDLEEFINGLFEKKKNLNDPYINWYVAYLKREEKVPVGMIGLDYRDHKYFVDYCLLPKARGENIGLMLAQQYSYYLVDDLGLDKIFGVIDKSNKASIMNAERIGYTKFDDTTYELDSKRTR